MATLLPTPPALRDAGVLEVYDKGIKFITKAGIQLKFDVTRDELQTAIGEIWDTLGDPDYAAAISGRLKAAIPKPLVHLIVSGVSRVQFEQANKARNSGS
jgi:hypothetical protein